MAEQIKSKEENSIIVEIILSLFLIGFFILIEIYVINQFIDHNLRFIIRLVEFFLVYNSIRAISRCFRKWKHYQILYKVVEFPNAVYPLVIKPYLKMILGLFLFFSVFYGGVYFIFKYAPEFFGYDLNYNTKAFLCVTTSSLLIRTFGNWLIKSLVRWNYKPDNEQEHINLTLSLINEERIRYFLYILFFIALCILPFYSLEGLEVFSHLNLPSAILSSFATFIAYDRLFNNWKLIKFNPKNHWNLLIKVYEKDSKYKGNNNYLIKKEKPKS